MGFQNRRCIGRVRSMVALRTLSFADSRSWRRRTGGFVTWCRSRPWTSRRLRKSSQKNGRPVRTPNSGGALGARRALFTAPCVSLAGGSAFLGALYAPRVRADELALRGRIKELAHKHRRYGYRRTAVQLRREGMAVNVKRVHRLWKEEGLGLRKKRQTRRQYGPKGEVRRRPSGPGRCGPMTSWKTARYAAGG